MHKEKRKLAKLSVFFEVFRSSFHRHSEGSNNNKTKTKQTVNQISNCHQRFYYCLFMVVRNGGPWTGPCSSPWTRSIGGVHGPGVSVLGSPRPRGRYRRNLFALLQIPNTLNTKFVSSLVERR